MNDERKWLLCPICGNKTRVLLCKNTELKNFLLFCPKCKSENIITVKEFQVVIEETAQSSTSTTQINKVEPDA